MNEKESERSFGELPTLGHEETRRAEPRSAAEGPSWTALGLSEAETLKPPAEGIRDDGRTDAARRWKVGEEILGRYLVERELGQGEMGVVYGCLDKLGGVRVAVKGLPPDLSHDSIEMEEVRENFRLVGDLRHPCIAGVRTLEKDERGEFYLVMDLVEGESLRKWERDKRKAGGVSLKEAVAVLRQVASALDYAHRRKVVHRDVKPGNVMIDGKGEVKVLDFGLADQIRTSLSRASHAHRGTSGTGPYMSPEQWRGQPQDGKTDQYALGVMAYEMLAGRLPFGSSDLGVLREMVLKEEPPAIPGLPESAMGAIWRAMAKRAEERFGSCGEFVEALEGKRKDRPTARPGQTDDAGAGRQGGDGDVFLRKVRVGKALEAARREDATTEETAELERVREVFVAGEEALKAGNHAVAAGLLGQCEEKLESWLKERLKRRERECAFVAAKRAEEQRKEETRREERKKRDAARTKRRREMMLRFVKIFGMLALVGVFVWGWRAITQRAVAQRSRAALERTKEEVSRLGHGTHVLEERTISLGLDAQMTFVWCPAGSFMMGSPPREDGFNPDEGQHQVTLTEGFWMAKTEVTLEQWENVMGRNPSRFKGANLPADHVSWFDAKEFCRRTGLRLPTEAEWEYACRAGSLGKYAGTGQLESMGWYAGNSEGKTHLVGQKQPNSWGLHDMHGNVMEWCEDWYTKLLGSGAVTNPVKSSESSGRVQRGGRWGSSARYCRSAVRDHAPPNSTGSGLGFGFRPCCSPFLL